MERLTQAQMNVLRRLLNEYRENFVQNREITGTRERALTVISTVFGDKSTEYARFRDIGFSSVAYGNGYTSDDIQTFISFIDGVLDTFDIFSA